MPPMPDLPTLTVEVAGLHRDHCEASRAAHLCAVVAGQRLMGLRRALGRKGWHEWLNGCGIPKSVVGEYLQVAQRHENRPVLSSARWR